MRIAIAGGTGTLGRRVVEELRRRGHEVRVLSRGAPEYPVDLSTGAGLDVALAGCDVVVDASNSTKHAETVLVAGTRRLLSAGKAAGVRHHVCVSIVGCDRVPIPYYRVKTQQEDLVTDGPVPWTVVRATQFHELAATLLTATGRWRVHPLPRVPLQTVASAEVARAVADVAVGQPRHGRVEVAGPEVLDLRELGRLWRSTTGRRVLPVPLPLPGRLGRALRDGHLTAAHPDVRGTTGFAAWLAAAER